MFKFNFMRSLFLIAMISILAGCGQTVRESLSPINTQEQAKNKINKKIVLLPLADYTQGRTPDDNLRRQVKINTSLNYRLSMYGLYSPLQEDVMQQLVDMGIISELKTNELNYDKYRHLSKEIGFDWSSAMQEEISRVYAISEATKATQGSMRFEQVGLNQEAVKVLGTRFNSEYLLRGRIVEYEMRQGHSLNPFQRGFLPVFFGVTSNALFGVAKTEQYDLWHDVAVGGTVGALIGTNLETPFNPPKKETTTITEGTHPRFMTQKTVTDYEGGYEMYQGLNAGVWGAAGAAAAYLSNKGGKIEKAVVQVSLALQKADDGTIIWQNRVEKEVEPYTMWANPTDRIVLDKAIEEAALSLIDDLAATLKAMPEPVIQQTAYIPPPPQAVIEEPISAPVEPMTKPARKPMKQAPLK